MRALPRDIGIIHFTGIGGIGMSGIAEILKNLGYEVQGSDIADNANVRRLRAIGVPVEIGHRAENLGKAKVVVVSSAVKPDNPEVIEARARLIPVVRRAEMLGQIFADPLDLAQRASRAHALAVPNAASKLADVVEDLAHSSVRREAA